MAGWAGSEATEWSLSDPRGGLTEGRTNPLPVPPASNHRETFAILLGFPADGRARSRSQGHPADSPDPAPTRQERLEEIVLPAAPGRYHAAFLDPLKRAS